jgi:cell division protein FtsB
VGFEGICRERVKIASGDFGVSMDPLFPARLLMILGIFVLGVGVFRGKYTMSNYFELKKSYQTLSSAVESLKDQNEKLATEIENISASADYARKVLRDKYHITDEGEEIIFVDGKE